MTDKEKFIINAYTFMQICEKVVINRDRLKKLITKFESLSNGASTSLDLDEFLIKNIALIQSLSPEERKSVLKPLIRNLKSLIKIGK